MRLFYVILCLFCFADSSSAGVRVRMRTTASSTQIISASLTKNVLSHGEARLLKRIPFFIPEGAPPSAELFEEYEIDEATAGPQVWSQMQTQGLSGAEFREVYVQGPHQNRINLTILGDGYTQSERQKFFDDVDRTVQGLFGGKTFKSYLPLFNIYAVFVPSQVSGIGDGSPRNTAFRLYRTPKGSKRAIMPGDTGALEDALRAAPATDYPIVIANDEFYGGLGGRYAISTSSVRSGMIVLRHELGHNFGEVGEEYDGGYVYSGANASSSTQVPWTHWTSGTAEVHQAKILTGDYVWKSLSTGPYTARFSIPNGFDLLYLTISSVGWDTAQDVETTLNGKPLSPEGEYTNDRSFFNVGPTPVKSGETYSLKIEEKVKDNNNVLGFAVAYVVPQNYDFTPDKIGAFATYDDYGNKTYRPTHESCLMRNMVIDYFCPIDQENMWHKFLNRVRLIDSLTVDNSGKAPFVKLETQNLSGLTIEWFDISNGTEKLMPELNGLTEWIPNSNSVSRVRVRVKLKTPEVRKYNSKFTDAAELKL